MDDLVPLEDGQETFKNLTSLGVNGDFIIEEYADHSSTKSELQGVYSWIKEILPEI
jgi:predicted esterase